MLKCDLGALALLAVLTQDASASEGHGVFHRVSCAFVRFYVSRYSADAAEAWARSHGATDTEIESARHCLSSDADTASLQKHRRSIRRICDCVV
jgi:hypothetical protein